MTERLDPGFAVFNGHVNDAAAKARAIFIANFGQDKWDEHIQPLVTAGIMLIFSQDPAFYTSFYIAAITMLVNGDVAATPEAAREAVRQGSPSS